MKTKNDYYKELREYYRDSNWLYRYIWYQGKSRGLHHGFVDEGNGNHTEALINQYRYIIKHGRIKAGMNILDAGCGVGGSAVFIAKSTKAKVVGISLVKEQIREAQYYAKNDGVSSLTNFIVGDYHDTKLPSGSFDVVYGMESICYANPKTKFLKEAWRLLKPGGTLIITDGYCSRKPINAKEKELVEEFCEGWRLSEIIELEKMNKLIEVSGFEKLTVEDKTLAIGLSVAKMRLIVRLWRLGKILVGWIKLPIIEMARLNAQAMKAWDLGLKSGLFGYYAQVAKKPKL